MWSTMRETRWKEQTIAKLGTRRTAHVKLGVISRTLTAGPRRRQATLAGGQLKTKSLISLLSWLCSVHHRDGASALHPQFNWATEGTTSGSQTTRTTDEQSLVAPSTLRSGQMRAQKNKGNEMRGREHGSDMKENTGQESPWLQMTGKPDERGTNEARPKPH